MEVYHHEVFRLFLDFLVYRGMNSLLHQPCTTDLFQQHFDCNKST